MCINTHPHTWRMKQNKNQEFFHEKRLMYIIKRGLLHGKVKNLHFSNWRLYVIDINNVIYILTFQTTRHKNDVPQSDHWSVFNFQGCTYIHCIIIILKPVWKINIINFYGVGFLYLFTNIIQMNPYTAHRRHFNKCDVYNTMISI